MQLLKLYINWSIIIACFLILLQSCTVYHSYNSSIDEAIESENKVKVNTANNDPYKFKKLVRIEDEVFGLVYSKSQSYKLLLSRKTIPTEQQTMFYVQLYDNELNDIHLKNKSASTIITVAIPAVAASLIIIPFVTNPLDPYGIED